MTTITLAQVKRAAMACRHASDARKAADSADSEKKFSMMLVLEPLLGIKSEDELQKLSPVALKLRAKTRIEAGLVQLEGIDAQLLLERVIQKSQARRNVSWKDAFVSALGESEATAVVESTSESYSVTNSWTAARRAGVSNYIRRRA
jgi:uncharacterized sporulation protein YeaH/YhbH (DUF444 family)